MAKRMGVIFSTRQCIINLWYSSAIFKNMQKEKIRDKSFCVRKNNHFITDSGIYKELVHCLSLHIMALSCQRVSSSSRFSATIYLVPVSILKYLRTVAADLPVTASASLGVISPCSSIKLTIVLTLLYSFCAKTSLKTSLKLRSFFRLYNQVAVICWIFYQIFHAGTRFRKYF